MLNIPADRKGAHVATRGKIARQSFPQKGLSVSFQGHVDHLY